MGCKEREVKVRWIQDMKPEESMFSTAAEQALVPERFLNAFCHSSYSSNTMISAVLGGQDQETLWHSVTLYSFSKCPKATLARSSVFRLGIP